MWPVIIGAAVAAAVGTIVSRMIERRLPPVHPPQPQPVVIVRSDADIEKKS